MLDLITRASLFGITKHGTQVRKYSGIPYFTHCCEVANIVAEVMDDPHTIAAAYCHDVLEDTDCTLDELESAIGPTASSWVKWLTDEPVVVGVNREKRKAMDRERLSRAPWQVHTLKLADMLSNGPSIRDNDLKFAPVWGREARALIQVLTLGDLTLRGKLLSVLDTFSS